MTPTPTISAATRTKLKEIASDIALVGTSVGVVLTALVNLAPSVHLPAPDIAILVSASAVVTAIVAKARDAVKVKVAAVKAAK